MLTLEQINRFKKTGFIHLTNVFNTIEIEKLRSACDNYSGGDVLGISSFGYILLDARIIEPLKQLLDNEIVYFGESNVSLEVGSRHMHNDSKRDNFDFNQSYPVFRVGIYLQDYKNFSGGLKLRPGSHNKFCIDKYGFKKAFKLAKKTGNWLALLVGKSFNVPTLPGDLLIWNMRTHHSGHAVRVIGLKNHSFHPWIEDRIPESLHLKDHSKRYVIFASYGAPSAQLEEYINDRVTKAGKIGYWKQSQTARFDIPEIQELANRKEVILRTDGLDQVFD